MADEIAFENGRISNFQGLVTLTLYRGILHTVVYHSSTSTCMPNFTEIEETDGPTYVRTDGHLRPTLLGRPSSPLYRTTWSTQRVELKMA